MKKKKQKPKDITGMRLFLKMTFRSYLKEWKLSTLLLVLTFLIVILQLMVPLLTSQMTMSIVGTTKADNPFFWGVDWHILIYVSVATAILNVIVSYLFNYISYVLGIRIEIALRNETLEKLVREDISYYSDKKIGEILTKVISDTQIFGNQAVNVPMQFGIGFFQLIAAMVMMYIFEWRLATINLVIFLIIFALIVWDFIVTAKRYNAFRTEVTEINGDVTDRLISIRLIKSTGTENYETERFKEVHKTFFKKALHVDKAQALLVTILFGGVAVIQFSSVIAAMLLYGNAGEAVAQQFFQNIFASFLLAQGILTSTLFSLMNSIFGLVQATISAERIQKSLDAPFIMDPHYHDGIEIDGIHGDIKFEGVSFSYPEKPGKVILPKFDFTFKEGKSYAFVGETGSGKSTISKLLLRFYDPTEGKVTINDGLDLKDLHLRSYLDYVGYVEQDPQIMFGDVYENVKYGVFEATNEEVIEACKKAELHDLIMTWPDGYNTILGERGFMLSGGQKQRLVIARMFLKDPQVLILDEATSALDNIVEKEIQAELEKLMVGKTTVSIAHRLSTIKNANQIVVLGQGSGIVQIGTFDELRNTPGPFQNLYKAGLME